MTPPGPPPVPGGRSSEEREAARREREARRAARKSKGDGGQVANDGDRVATDGDRPTPPTRPAPPPARARKDRAAAKQDGAPPKEAKRAGKQQERAAARESRRAEKEERKAARAAFKEREDARRAEEKARKAERKAARKPSPPPKQRRSTPGAGAAAETWRDRAQRLTAGRDKGAPKKSAAPKKPAGPRDHRRTVYVLGAAGVLLLLVGIWFMFSLFQPLAGDGNGEGRVRVRVPQGAGVEQIADLLEQRGVVGSSFFFQTRARLSGRGGDLKPGAYVLGEGMSIGTALDALTEGPTPNVLNVTVPEGRSRTEVARTIPPELRGNYVQATRRSRLLRPSRYGAPRGASLEGFLFPSTYEIKKGRPVNVLVAEQLTAFRTRFAKVSLRAARRANLTPYEVLTIASMIEREAQQPRERRLVSSVIYNRLRDGIPLGIDATVRYVTNNWSRPLTQSQLQVQSPYNTRRNRGLPPGPIGSPGIEAIRAAAQPARTGYLFYVVKPGACGEHAFSKTNAQFEADVARYNRERARRGGKSPTKC